MRHLILVDDHGATFLMPQPPPVGDLPTRLGIDARLVVWPHPLVVRRDGKQLSPVRQTATGVFNLLREGAVGFGLQLQGCLPSSVLEVWVLALAQDVPAGLLERAVARRAELAMRGVVEFNMQGCKRGPLLRASTFRGHGQGCGRLGCFH